MVSASQRLRIRARSGVAAETLNAYLDDPKRVRAASATRIEEAARAEGITLPVHPSTSPPPRAA
jgi:hypothetical protein